MSISIVSSPITSLYTKFDIAATSRASATVATAATLAGGGDSPVTISNAARQALGAEQVAGASGGKVQEELPEGLLMLQLPPWLVDFGFKAPSVGDDLSGKWFAEQYPQAAAAPRGVLDEYSNKLEQHFQAVVKSNGLDSNTKAFHEAMVVDKQSSERIRQEFVNSIKRDPEMMRLMNQLGMSGPLNIGNTLQSAGSGQVAA